MPKKSVILSPDKSGLLDVLFDRNIQRVLILPGTSEMKAFVYEFITMKDSPQVTTILVEPSLEEKFIVRPIFFDFNSTDIDIADIPYLHQLLDVLRKNKRLKLYLNGYSDGVGSYSANMNISIKRAKKVKEFLVKFGIHDSRIKTTGFGHLKNRADYGPQYNRRVDFILK
jgi:outer membrane protein OmpA-like peptidoglycan-associated protein